MVLIPNDGAISSPRRTHTTRMRERRQRGVLAPAAGKTPLLQLFSVFTTLFGFLLFLNAQVSNTAPEVP
jgi:hypothetical protein